MRLQELLDQAGVFQSGLVDTAGMRFEQAVRDMCAVNTCQKYNTSWACPPAVGTVEECRARIQQYEKFLLFSVKYDLEDSFDYEGMMAGASAFKETCRALDNKLRPLLGNYLMLSNEGCGLCKECTYLAGGLWAFCQQARQAGRHELHEWGQYRHLFRRRGVSPGGARRI